MNSLFSKWLAKIFVAMSHNTPIFHQKVWILYRVIAVISLSWQPLQNVCNSEAATHNLLTLVFQDFFSFCYNFFGHLNSYKLHLERSLRVIGGISVRCMSLLEYRLLIGNVICNLYLALLTHFPLSSVHSPLSLSITSSLFHSRLKTTCAN